jgi:PAS domain S-box-containing protein
MAKNKIDKTDNIQEINLEENKNLLQTIVKSISDGIILLDENLKLKYISQLYENNTGYQQNELINTSALSYIYEEDIPIAIEAIQKIISGEQQQIEFRLKHKNGALIWMEARGNILKKANSYQIIIATSVIQERKSSELKIKDSETKLKGIFNNTQQIFFLLDTNRKILAFNKSAQIATEHSLNITPKNGALMDNYIFKKDLDTYIKNFNKALNNESSVVETYSIKNKQEWIYNIYYEPVSIKNKIIGVSMNFLDITEQKQQERAKIEKEQDLKFISENTLNMLNIETENDIYLHIGEQLNKQLKNTIVLVIKINKQGTFSQLMYHSSFSGSIYNKIKKIVPQSQINKKFRLYKSLLDIYKLGKLTEFEGNLGEFSKGEFPASIANVLQKLLKITQIHTIGISHKKQAYAAIHFFSTQKKPLTKHDFIEAFVRQAGIILQRKLIEQELAKNLLMLQETQEIANIGGWELDLETNTQTWTKQTYAIHEVNETYTPTFDNGVQFYHPDDREIISQAVIACINNKSKFNEELRIITAKGKEIWVQSKGVAVVENGKTIKLQGTIQDITIKRQYQERLKAAKNKAEESDRLKSAFLSNMSHEIRTPMNSIMGFSELLTENNLTSEERKRYGSIVKNSCSDLLSLINDILDLSRIEAGQLKLEMKHININELLEKKLLNYTERNKRLINSPKIILKQNNQTLTTVSDANRLSQILENLISNAIKFAPNGIIEFGANKNNNKIEFFVKDNGIGIKPEDCKRIFNRFYQTENYLQRKHNGLGLGLSICQNLVNALSGDIWVESEYGKWTTFWFNIPIENSKSVIIPTNRTPYFENAFVNNKSSILIAEDNKGSIEYYTEILKTQETISFEIVELGKDVLKRCFEKTYDVVFLDINLPDINGFELMKQLKTSGFKSPIIAQTAYSMENERIKCLKEGFNDYLSKPFSINEFLNMINKHLKN